MRTMKLSIMMLCLLFVAGALSGCGSSSKEGSAATNPASVAELGDTVCFQCHSSTIDPLTGDSIVEQYKRSTHAEIGCESCHGGGAEHNGIGPLAYTLNNSMTDAQKAERCAQCHDGVTSFKGRVAPLSSSINFSNGNHGNPFSAEEAHEPKCSRCHSHEGAVLQGTTGFTGEKAIMDNAAFEPVLPRDPETFNTIKCATCHEHGANLRQWKTRDAAGNVVAWDPNKNFVNDQIDLCTGCHTMTTNAGVLIGSGNTLTFGTTNVPTAAFYHNTRWFRTLPSTHYDQPATVALTGGVIEGYNIRRVSQVKNPCFDCHGHEYKTNTRALADQPARGETIFTQWGRSGHAGKILTQKVAAAASAADRTTAQVDAVMKAGVTEASGAAWIHYDWDNSTGSADDRKTCQMCHTSTGISNYLNSLKNSTTYDPANNNFTHLSGWTNSNKTSPQNELLYCWGCHDNAGRGTLRQTGSATLTPTFLIGGQRVTISNVGNSAVCIVCHGGRGSASEAALTDTRSSRFNGHHAPTAGVMFAAQTHIAFEYAGQNYINPAFQHDKINAATDGPCVSCHMSGENHTFAAVTEAGGVVTAINNQALCNTCHGVTPASLEEAKAGYGQASTILNNYVSNVAGFPSYLGFAITSSNYNNLTLVPDEAYGAYQNGKLNTEEPCAFVHNPTYARRVIFDSIDWMDNGVLNGSISFNATTFAKAAAWLGKPTATGVTTFTRP